MPTATDALAHRCRYAAAAAPPVAREHSSSGARDYADAMPSALEGFLAFDCDDDLASRLRTEVAVAQGAGYDVFEFNTFDVELFYAENRVAIREAAALGYDAVELTVADFLAALPDVPPGPRMYGRPRRVIVPPPPSD